MRPESNFTPYNINEQLIYSRAIEAVNWGMPAVNYEPMYQAANKIGTAFNQIVYWSGLPDWKNLKKHLLIKHGSYRILKK
jgi:hypothetical protein